MTTIKINEDTKESLSKIAGQLQFEKEGKINYNSTIRFLITSYLKRKNKAKLKKACEKIADLNIEYILDELSLERKKDDKTF